MSSALADLVTQAPEADELAGATVKHYEGTPSKFSQWCSCLGGKKRPQPAASLKLAAIVPVEVSTEVELATPQLPERDVALEAPGTCPATELVQCRQGPAPPSKVPPPSREAIWGPNKDQPPQLGPQVGQNQGRKTLVLDLDETLVHSSFRSTTAADIIILVELEGEHHRVYVRKRPFVDEFLLKVCQMYEVVVYTASMAKYANPLLDELDISSNAPAAFRLFREACTRYPQGYVKDLRRLGRDLKHTIIIDNSPICYALQPNNAIPIKMFKDDVSDRELLDLIPILHSLTEVSDIPVVLKQIAWTADDDDDRR